MCACAAMIIRSETSHEAMHSTRCNGTRNTCVGKGVASPVAASVAVARTTMSASYHQRGCASQTTAAVSKSATAIRWTRRDKSDIRRSIVAVMGAHSVDQLSPDAQSPATSSSANRHTEALRAPSPSQEHIQSSDVVGSITNAAPRRSPDATTNATR